MDRFACKVEILSWASVFSQGEAARETLNHDKLEEYMRLRVRNDISFLDHEFRQAFDISYVDPTQGATPLDRELGKLNQDDAVQFYNRMARENKKRSRLGCIVWTVGKGYPVALNVKCTLSSWHDDFENNEYSSEHLGYTHQESLHDSVKEQIQLNIESIAKELYRERQELTDLQHGTE